MISSLQSHYNCAYRTHVLSACLGSALFVIFPFAAWAQNPPVDLPDLSLADLLKVTIAETDATESGKPAERPRLHLKYQYIRNQFKGYRSSTHGVAMSSLFPTGLPPAPGKFPVLPRRIVQQAHTFTASYDVLEDTVLSLMLPYIRQRTDHLSIVPGFPAFRIASDGIGDVAVSATHRFWQSPGRQFHWILGVSAPTGSINQKGDTPRSPPGGRDQLPYTMQLGSGTWDVTLGGGYSGQFGDTRDSLRSLGTLDWGLDVNGKLRAGHNDRDYRLGHVLTTSVWIKAAPVDWLRPKLALATHVWGRIHGEDQELKIGVGANAFFPSPVTDPHLYGGERVNLVVGVELGRRDANDDGILAGLLQAQSYLEFGVPVYQRLNGPQVEQDWQFSANLNWRF